MTVSKWMGHRDPRVTLSTYAKVIEELEEASRDSIGTAMVPVQEIYTTQDLFLSLEWLNIPDTEFVEQIFENTYKTKPTQS